MKRNNVFSIFLILSLIGLVNPLKGQSNSPEQDILIDVAHGQKFWKDIFLPENSNLQREKYLASEIEKTITPFNGQIGFINTKINKEILSDCKVLFIHVPTMKYSKNEILSITQFIRNGGSLFLVMEEDYWTTLEQTNVNDIISPFEMQFGGLISDSTTGGHTKEGKLTKQSIKIPYQGGRIVKGGIPFCFSNASDDIFFGTYKKIENGGKIVIMGDGMVSLYMNSWEDVKDYQCREFMTDVFDWLMH